MSVRQLLVTDSTNPDFGKIAPIYIPNSSHPPITNTKAQTVTAFGEVNKGGGVPAQNILALGAVIADNFVGEPLYIGDLQGSAITLDSFPNINFNSIKVKAQIIFCNVAVSFINGVGGFVPPKQIPVQFYVQTADSENQMALYPIQTVLEQGAVPPPPANPIEYGLAITAPIMYLQYSNPADVSEGEPFEPYPYTYYYSGVGIFDDEIPASDYTNMQFFALMLNPDPATYSNPLWASGQTMTSGTTETPTIPADRAGIIQYQISYTCTN
jgi:hypothetical protein